MRAWPGRTEGATFDGLAVPQLTFNARRDRATEAIAEICVERVKLDYQVALTPFPATERRPKP